MLTCVSVAFAKACAFTLDMDGGGKASFSFDCNTDCVRYKPAYFSNQNIPHLSIMGQYPDQAQYGCAGSDEAAVCKLVCARPCEYHKAFAPLDLQVVVRQSFFEQRYSYPGNSTRLGQGLYRCPRGAGLKKQVNVPLVLGATLGSVAGVGIVGAVLLVGLRKPLRMRMKARQLYLARKKAEADGKKQAAEAAEAERREAELRKAREETERIRMELARENDPESSGAESAPPVKETVALSALDAMLGGTGDVPFGIEPFELAASLAASALDVSAEPPPAHHI